MKSHTSHYKLKPTSMSPHHKIPDIQGGTAYKYLNTSYPCFCFHSCLLHSLASGRWEGKVSARSENKKVSRPTSLPGQVKPSERGPSTSQTCGQTQQSSCNKAKIDDGGHGGHFLDPCIHTLTWLESISPHQGSARGLELLRDVMDVCHIA